MFPKYTLSIFLVILVSQMAFSQQLDKQVIASSGHTATSSYTIGETVIMEGGIRLISGFQQPAEMEKMVALGFRDISHLLTAYPNPAQQYVTISGHTFTTSTTEVALFDLQGNELNTGIESTTDGLLLILPKVAAGKYVLLLRDTEAKTVASFNLLKHN